MALPARSDRVIAHLILAAILLVTGCRTTTSDTNDDWSGTIDTLASGEITIRNTSEPLWTPKDVWKVTEELRIGSDSSENAILIGRIVSFDMDAQGRIYVLDGQSQEIQIFDSDGAFVRTVGSTGSGPGEFERASAVDISRNGEIWVMEMGKGQLTIFDSIGTYLRTHSVGSAGRYISPYPGGFDPLGRYNAVISRRSEGRRKSFMARFTQSFSPLDTIPIPEMQRDGDRDYFTLVDDRGRSIMRASVPFVGGMSWRFSPEGTLWKLFNREYELVEISETGNVLRRVTKEFEPVNVTDADLREARESFTWFTDQGGTFDSSKIPRTKPVVGTFFCDDEGNLWVWRNTWSEEDEGRHFDLFDAEGRYLGLVQLPFPLVSTNVIVQNGRLIGRTRDDLGGPNIVVARINKPSQD